MSPKIIVWEVSNDPRIGRWGQKCGVAAMIMNSRQLLWRARDIRGQMSKHIREGTIDPDSKSLVSEGKTVYNKINPLQSESAARKEALEEKYLTGAPSAVIEEISTVERQCNLLKREVEQWEATVPPPPVPNSRRPNVPPSEGCCGANCGPRKAFFHRHLRV